MHAPFFIPHVDHSTLKRMSAVVSVQEGSRSQLLAVCKGAPEVLEGMLAHLPPGYAECHKTYSRQGARVLALGFKVLQVDRDVSRDGVVFIFDDHASG